MAKVKTGAFRREVSPAKSQFYNGRHYRSKREAGYAQKLDILLKAGEITAWEYEPPLKVFINGKWIFTYKIDFKVIHGDNSVEFVEVKGFETMYWRLKFKIVDAILSGDPNENIYIKDVDVGSELTIIK